MRTPATEATLRTFALETTNAQPLVIMVALAARSAWILRAKRA